MHGDSIFPLYDTVPNRALVLFYVTPESSSAAMADGTATFSGSATGAYGTGREGVGNSDGSAAWVEYSVLLQAGTYSFTLHHRQNINRGKYQLLVNGTAHGTLVEGYAASGAATVTVLTGVSVPTTGIQTIRWRILDKNASSSGYIFSAAGFEAQRTGA